MTASLNFTQKKHTLPQSLPKKWDHRIDSNQSSKSNNISNLNKKNNTETVIFVSILEKNPETKNILQNPGAWFSRQIPCLRWCYISCYIVRHRLAGCVIGQRYAFSHKKINKNFLEGKRPSKSGDTSGKVEHVGNHQLEENVYSFVITDNVKIVYMGLLS